MIEVIAQHADYCVVYKPADVNFHDEGDIGQGFFNQAQKQLQCDALYPAHRLDKMTSGLVILAKNKASAAQFQQLFSQHKIDKFYLAISHQKPKKKQGTIKGDMAKSRRGAYKLLRTTNNPAISQFFSHSLGQGQRLYLLRPLSGKTHQLRVALASIGAPILGDNLYAKGEHSESDRGYLHAFRLSFNWQGEQQNYTCLPRQGRAFLTDDCQAQINQWLEPELLNWPKR
ncbi:TIGR01621 family pseudouridine synthase [Thalassotalea sp. LPB0316]|uniref:TIGR01621 family pseudouridine synthase n=1 Tax=Thalassotalea sp. LPB0316 TaxID=2769490 RepID=UPI0018662D30|nr:TIGR01621 family pseudouridine synthase [Thalassotalea sp. LPB0316]QOL26881.1 TIGR01621 family pseudouridine synthase [Thalassotalea sp. LPB0316]